MDFKTIEHETLRLSPEDRAKLVQRLLLSLDSLSEAETEQSWLIEAQRRAQEIDRGEVQAIPAERSKAEGTGAPLVSYQFHPAAEAEHLEAIAYYESQQARRCARR